MGLLLALSKRYVPQFVQKRQLEKLFKATAEAFQSNTPTIRELTYDEGLTQFALFTREQAEKVIQQGRALEVQGRLFQNAYKIGEQFRIDFRIKSAEEAMQMGELVYKLLKIDFHGEPEGNIVIKQCFFSEYYSSRVCQLISSLDEGLLTGLSGGGRLSFTQRITESKDCCRAYLTGPRRGR